MLSVLLLAADGASGTGGADAGESASTWSVGGFLFWVLVVLVAVGVLVAVLMLAARGRAGGADAGPDGAQEGAASAMREGPP